MGPITVEWLKERGACQHQIQGFERVFGADAVVPASRENYVRAKEAGLNLLWVGRHLSTAVMRRSLDEQMARIRKEIKEVRSEKSEVRRAAVRNVREELEEWLVSRLLPE